MSNSSRIVEPNRFPSPEDAPTSRMISVVWNKKMERWWVMTAWWENKPIGNCASCTERSACMSIVFSLP